MGSEMCIRDRPFSVVDERYSFTVTTSLRKHKLWNLSFRNFFVILYSYHSDRLIYMGVARSISSTGGKKYKITNCERS